MTLATDVPSTAEVWQRSRGHVGIVLGASGPHTTLRDLSQSGCGRARFPRVADGRHETVLVNTAGGLTGGDRWSVDLVVEAGAHALVTSQAAEKVYRAATPDGMGEAPAATAQTRLAVGASAWLAFLPQETILFDRGRLIRRLDADVAGTGALLILESVVLGRMAMGESVAHGAFEDHWRIRRDGRLLFADGLCLVPGEGGQARALLGSARAFATVLLVAPAAEGLCEAARAAIAGAPAGFEAGVSAWKGMLVVRAVAADGAGLRAGLAPILAALYTGALPRVWSC